MKSIIFNISLLLLTISLFSQNKTILEIENKKINSDEFIYFYNKNNSDKSTMSYNSLKDYMDSFINFKLKVYDAEAQKMDTSNAFKNELNGYRSKLAQPYLTDKKSEEEVVREYYNRSLYNVNASHILIEVKKEQAEEDTIDAYKKIYDIYKKLQKGEDFEKLAIENSEDKSVAQNKGHLGFNTVDKFVYEFEEQMYNTPVGQFSKPFRTQYGYHIVKVTDKQKSRGQYKVAHIMRAFPKEISWASRRDGTEKFTAVYNQIKNGELSFEDGVQRYSDDRKTAERNGEIGWIAVGGRYIKEFENAVFSMNNIGDITFLETNYGCHIIKLIDIEPVKPFEEVERDIKARIQNTQRTLKSREIVLDKLKKEYKLTKINENIIPIYNVITDSLFAGTLKIDNIESFDKTIFTFADEAYSQKDFINYIMKFNRKQTAIPIKPFIDQKIDDFANKMLINFEETQLENKYSDFKNILKEYHDGILLFQIADNNVWGKAIKDTAGLERFFNEHKMDYMWNFRYNVKIYSYKDDATAKNIEKMLKKNVKEAEMLTKLNKKDSSAVTLGKSYFCEKNKELVVDNLITNYSIPQQGDFVKIINNPTEKTITYIKVESPTAKSLSECKGNVTADYQKILEENWIKNLKAKYKVVVHNDVLKEISTE